MRCDHAARSAASTPDPFHVVDQRTESRDHLTGFALAPLRIQVNHCEVEAIAPQRIRNNVFVRETVADLLRQARRDVGGRELRGLAWRMVAPRG
jgi:hypothetical protein